MSKQNTDRGRVIHLDMVHARTEGRAQLAEARITRPDYSPGLLVRATPPERSRRSEVAERQSPKQQQGSREPPAGTRQMRRPRWIASGQAAPPHWESGEAEAWEACAIASEVAAAGRVVIVAAARAVSPDHYGLRRHLAERPKEAPRIRPKSGASVARQGSIEPDAELYIDAWTRPSRRW